MSEWTKDGLDQAKQLAPWRSNLPWWVVLIEGLVLGAVGVLILMDPQQTSVNVALFLTIILIISGILQLWSAIRDKVAPGAESVVTARGAIALFSGISIWLLLYMDALTPEVGRILFGLGALTYGLLGFAVVFATTGTQRRTAIIESIFYTVIGLLMIYVLFAGPTAVVTATRIVGWLALLCGLALIGLSIWRWQQGRQADEAIEKATDAVEEKADKVADSAKSDAKRADDSKEVQKAQDDARDAVADAADKVEEAAKPEDPTPGGEAG